VRSGVCPRRKSLIIIQCIGMGLSAGKSTRFENNAESKACMVTNRLPKQALQYKPKG